MRSTNADATTRALYRALRSDTGFGKRTWLSSSGIADRYPRLKRTAVQTALSDWYSRGLIERNGKLYCLPIGAIEMYERDSVQGTLPFPTPRAKPPVVKVSQRDLDLSYVRSKTTYRELIDACRGSDIVLKTAVRVISDMEKTPRLGFDWRNHSDWVVSDGDEDIQMMFGPLEWVILSVSDWSLFKIGGGGIHPINITRL